MKSEIERSVKEFTVPVFPPMATVSGYSDCMCRISCSRNAALYSSPMARLYQFEGMRSQPCLTVKLPGFPEMAKKDLRTSWLRMPSGAEADLLLMKR